MSKFLTSLSICIPTYKRSKPLAELLDSIIAQGLTDIEVVVSDDASPDDTVAVAESYRAKIPNFKFIRQPVNLGLNGNILAVVAAATGDYVWLIGDDDRLEPRGAQRVLDAIDRWPGLCGLTLGVIDYDSTMQRRVGIRDTPATQTIAGVGPVFGSIAELLGFLSALVVDRRKWKAIASDPETGKVDHYYVHVHIVGKILGRDGLWGIVHEPCVGFRTENDQFLEKFGWLGRLKVDVDAYEQLGSTILQNDDKARVAMRQRIFDTHVMARIINVKTETGSTPELLKAVAFLAKNYGRLPRFWTRALPALLVPKWVIGTMRRAHKKYVKSSGAARARISDDN
jgi:glycosyltransferase involved in cell wall biosynthesis